MDEDDHDELLQCTDDESMSESDDQCVPMPKSDPQKPFSINKHSLCTYLATKTILMLSSGFLIILFPLYFESINAMNDSYTGILFSSITVFFIFLITLIIAKIFSPKYKILSIFKPPLKWLDLGKLSLVYTVSGFIVVYALDQKKVMCHLQDPIKGTVLVFSLLYYFLFCKKLMGLQRIFSTTIIIVGLFIALDYGLCDEFKCRGYEREHKSDDTGPWKWPINSIWTGIYLVGIGLFAAFFSILERFIVPVERAAVQTTVTTSLLTTISRIVSFPNTSAIFQSETRPLTSLTRSPKSFAFLHLSFWIQAASLFFTVALFWIELVPNVGRNNDIDEYANKTLHGLFCHFSQEHFDKDINCAKVSLFGWLFAFDLSIFIASAILFVTITHSAVYTVSVMSASIPLVGIWWSLFRMVPIREGLIQWSPVISGELICALLGFPIVLIGLGLFCKCHLADCKQAKEVSAQNEPAQLA